MPCSTCSADVLRFFLRSLIIQPLQGLQKSSLRPIQRRALQTTSSLRITSGSSRGFNHGGLEDLPPTSFDNVYLPFDQPPTKSERSHLSSRSPAMAYSTPEKPLMPETVVAQDYGGVSPLDDLTQPDTSFKEPKIWLRHESSAQKPGDDGSTKELHSHSEERDVARHGLRQKPVKQNSTSLPASGSAGTKQRSKRMDRPTQRTTRAVGFTPNPREPWQIQKKALGSKFGEAGWQPRKRLSPDALDGIRALHAQYPQTYTTDALANQFKISPEAIRRILKSKWRPSEEEDLSRRQRWQKRGEAIWTQMVELGVKPPKKWREMGVGRSSEAREKLRAGLYDICQSDNILAASDDVTETIIMAEPPDAAKYVGRSLSDRIL